MDCTINKVIFMTISLYNTQIAVNLLQQLMHTATKEVYYDKWKEIKNCLALLTTESFRCNQSDQVLKSIVGSLFGSGKHKGLIEKRLPYYFKNAPSCWSQEVYQLVEFFSPKSEVVGCPAGILRNKDYQIAIEFKILPKSVQSEFPTSQCRNSRMLKSLKRVSADHFVISMWQWLWVHVANALVSLPEIDENLSTWDEQVEDELYYIISRNPVLLLLRKALITEYSETKGKQLMERMRGVFQLFIIEDLISFVNQSNLHERNSYQLRSHHLAAMFLLICSRKENLRGDTLQIYHEYFQNATQVYSSITKTGRNNLHYLIRTWNFFITRKNGADYLVFKQLDKANPHSGWFKLQRCPIKTWMKQAKEPELQTYQQRLITSTRNKIYRLLRNYDGWVPNFSFVYALEQFVQLDKNILSVCIRKPRKEEDDRTARQCFQRILSHLAENGADQKVLQQIQRKLNDQFLLIWDKLININFVEKGETAKIKSFTTIRTERSQEISLNYQSPRIRNVWQHQRQEFEFQSLLIASRWLAGKLDKLIPGHKEREFPCINTRIFANPFVFLGCVLMMVLFIRSNLRE